MTGTSELAPFAALEGRPFAARGSGRLTRRPYSAAPEAHSPSAYRKGAGGALWRHVDATHVIIASLLIALSIIGGFRVALLLSELAAHSSGVHALQGHNDFLAFYSGAHYVLAGRAGDIYSATALASYQLTLVPHSVGSAGYMPFLNPPFAAVMQSPLALMSEPVARLVWFAINALLALAIAFWITSSLPARQRALACVMIVGTFPFYQALVQGQWSVILLLGCLGALHFARRGSYIASGACLSVLWLKPQLALIVLPGLLIFRYRRIALGMAGAACLVALASLPVTGVQPYIDYVPFLLNVSLDHVNSAGALEPAVWRGDLSLTQGLNGLFVGLFSQSSSVVVNALTFLSVGATLLLFRRAALRTRPAFGHVTNEMMLVASVCLVLLIDPHLFAQDITLLFVVVPILTPHVKHPFAMVLGLCLLTDAPLIDQAVPLHLFTLALWCATAVICLAVVRERVHENNRAVSEEDRTREEGQRRQPLLEPATALPSAAR